MGYTQVSRETELYICKLIVDVPIEGLDHRVFPKDSFPSKRIIEATPSPEETLDVMPIAVHQTEEEIKKRFMCMRNAVDD